MESEPRSHLQQGLGREAGFPNAHGLDVPDEYGFMDPEVVTLLRASVEPAWAP